MNAAQATMSDNAPPPDVAAEEHAPVSTWRDYESDPVPQLRHLPATEQIKRCMARFVYRHRNELTRDAMELGGEHRRITWGEWFRLKYGHSLDDYELQLKQKGI